MCLQNSGSIYPASVYLDEKKFSLSSKALRDVQTATPFDVRAGRSSPRHGRTAFNAMIAQATPKILFCLLGLLAHSLLQIVVVPSTVCVSYGRLCGKCLQQKCADPMFWGIFIPCTSVYNLVLSGRCYIRITHHTNISFESHALPQSVVRIHSGPNKIGNRQK